MGGAAEKKGGKDKAGKDKDKAPAKKAEPPGPSADELALQRLQEAVQRRTASATLLATAYHDHYNYRRLHSALMITMALRRMVVRARVRIRQFRQFQEDEAALKMQAYARRRKSIAIKDNRNRLMCTVKALACRWYLHVRMLKRRRACQMLRIYLLELYTANGHWTAVRKGIKGVKESLIHLQKAARRRASIVTAQRQRREQEERDSAIVLVQNAIRRFKAVKKAHALRVEMSRRHAAQTL